MDSPEELISSLESLTVREGEAIYLEDRTEKILDKLAETQPTTAIFLKAFLDCLPPDGVENFRQDILALTTPEELYRHKDALTTGLLLPLKNKGQTPNPTASPISEIENDVVSLAAVLQTFEPGKRQSALRRVCLERDGFRCIATGCYDMTSFKDLSPEDQEQIDSFIFPTQVAHILPCALSTRQTSQNEPNARVWTYIYRYFPSVRLVADEQEINEKINDPINAFVLESTFHQSFDNFGFAFKPIDGDNTYECICYEDRRWGGRQFMRDIVTLHDQGSHIRLPSRTLLGLHAAIAEVLHLTGAGEAIDRVLRDREEIHVLAQDGSTDIESLMHMLTVH